VTYPYIASGQYVKKEPSDKFVRLERHGLFTVIVGIVSPEKRDIAILVGKDAIIADRDSVGISAEVLKNTFGATEGRFAIDDPLLFIELFPEDLEVAWIFEMTDTTRENKITSFETMLEVVKKLAAEQRRHDSYVDEESLAA
jgi:hypothetical protein